MDNSNTPNDNFDDSNLPQSQRPRNNVCRVCQNNFAEWDKYDNPMVCGFVIERTICRDCFFQNK